MLEEIISHPEKYEILRRIRYFIRQVFLIRQPMSYKTVMKWEKFERRRVTQQQENLKK